jgi:cysteine desulfurase
VDPLRSVVYLDHAASTPLDARVVEVMRVWLEGPGGNPSSRHPYGVRAAEAIDRARAQVARAMGVHAPQVVFTSGGTEANSLAVLGIARAAHRQGRHVLAGPTEHPCVRESAQALREEGFEVETLRLEPDGGLDLADLERKLRPDTVLVAQMLANNEFGTVYPIREVARLVRARSPRARVHVDAVQAFGKLECSPLELGADSVAISAHKAHGPQGAGALVLAGELALRASIYGGGQERGMRSGTENVPGIAGLGRAAELADELRETTVRVCTEARARLRELVSSLPGARILEPGSSKATPLCSVLAVLLPGAPAEVRMHHLEARGIYLSAGSACNTKKKDASPALQALGLTGEDARAMLRFSFSRVTRMDEIERAAAALREVCEELATAPQRR